MSASEPEPEPQHSGLNFHDLLFIFFRHKWKILLFALAGLAAAVALYFILPRYYEADAKLLVRYVVDKSAADSPDDPQVRSGSQSENVINSEVEIMTTLDLAKEVAQAVGVDRVLRKPEAKGQQKADAKGRPEAKAGGPEEAEGRLVAAARTILGGLKVIAIRDTDLISISYKNKDPQLALQVLQELVTRYFDKHLEVHRSLGAFEFVKRETDQLGARLIQTEEELKQLKAKAGISSLAEITTTLNAELVKAQEELATAEAEFAAQQARVQQIEKWLAGADVEKPDSGTRDPSSEVIHEYQALVSRVAVMRQTIIELQTKYTPTNPLVKGKQAVLNDLERQQLDLEKKFPNLVARLPSTSSQQTLQSELGTQRAQLSATEARIEALKTRLNGLQEKAKTIWDMGPKIGQLERQKEVEEKNYKYYESSLEKARIDEALNPARMPNINVVQQPVLAEKASGSNRPKFILGAAGAGLAFGIALALLQELLLDRSVKRRRELETQLRIPLLLSIPYFGRNGHLRLPAHNGNGNSVKALPARESSAVAPWESQHPIHSFCEALRDRLILYFERNGLTHKPKLVAVTGCSPGAGASTIAAGLAATLSEACDGKVLLVDRQVDPRSFFKLLAEFKGSDFDYIIFDLPSVSDTGSTLAMASLMDKVLLVVESEGSDRDVVKRAYAELVGADAKVSAVFNKSRSYGPKWLAGRN
jgi:uncharacterized protein involved in exopolysaccharide biosynthesis